MFGKTSFPDGTSMLFGPDNTEASGMIISNRLTRVLAGASFSISHYLHGEENESSECIQGSPRDLMDAYDSSRRKRLKYATVDFVIAPYHNLTRDEFLRVVLPMLAWIFSFSPLEAIVFEHKKPRTNGGADIHWHVCVCYADPTTGRVNREGWAWSHAKCERVSRHLEALYEPDNILLGRHQVAVIKALRADGYNDIADKIEKAHPAGAAPKNRTPALAIEQAAKMSGIELRDAMAAVRGCWHRSNNRTEFAADLEDQVLKLAISDREKPAWVITDPDGTFINLLSKCLPGVTRVKITQKIGEPTDDDTRHRSALERRAPAEHVARDPGLADEHAQLVGGDDFASARSIPQDDAGFEGRFVEALNAHNPRAFDSLLSTARELAQGAAARVRQFFDWVEAKARSWLNHRQTDQTPPEPDVKLLEAREVVAKAYSAMGTANLALHEAQLRISCMIDVPSSAKVGNKANLDAATKEAIALEEAHKRAVQFWEAQRAKLDPIEAAFANTVTRWIQRRDLTATRWLSVAERARKLLETNPAMARFGPKALFEIGMKAEENRRLVSMPNDGTKPPSGFSPPGFRG